MIKQLLEQTDDLEKMKALLQEHNIIFNMDEIKLYLESKRKDKVKIHPFFNDVYEIEKEES